MGASFYSAIWQTYVCDTSGSVNFLSANWFDLDAVPLLLASLDYVRSRSVCTDLPVVKSNITTNFSHSGYMFDMRLSASAHHQVHDPMWIVSSGEHDEDEGEGKKGKGKLSTSGFLKENIPLEWLCIYLIRHNRPDKAVKILQKAIDKARTPKLKMKLMGIAHVAAVETKQLGFWRELGEIQSTIQIGAMYSGSSMHSSYNIVQNSIPFDLFTDSSIPRSRMKKAPPQAQSVFYPEVVPQFSGYRTDAVAVPCSLSPVQGDPTVSDKPASDHPIRSLPARLAVCDVPDMMVRDVCGTPIVLVAPAASAVPAVPQASKRPADYGYLFADSASDVLALDMVSAIAQKENENAVITDTFLHVSNRTLVGDVEPVAAGVSGDLQQGAGAEDVSSYDIEGPKPALDIVERLEAAYERGDFSRAKDLLIEAITENTNPKMDGYFERFGEDLGRALDQDEAFDLFNVLRLRYVEAESPSFNFAA